LSRTGKLQTSSKRSPFSGDEKSRPDKGASWLRDDSTDSAFSHVEHRYTSIFCLKANILQEFTVVSGFNEQRQLASDFG
jgi:hypothetical protein